MTCLAAFGTVQSANPAALQDSLFLAACGAVHGANNSSQFNLYGTKLLKQFPPAATTFFYYYVQAYLLNLNSKYP